MPPLLVFQTFPTNEQALRTAALLENRSIPVAVEELQGPLDANFIGQQFSNPFLLKIPGEEFDHARAILMEAVTVDLDEVDEDYMLFDFNDQELFAVLASPEEWGVFNYKLAEALLEQRGVTIPQQQVAQMASEHLAELKKPQKASRGWIIFGYLSALLASGIGFSNLMMVYLPGLFALATGWALAFSSKTVPDGSRVPAFGKTARTHGLVIFMLAILLFMIWIGGAILFFK